MRRVLTFIGLYFLLSAVAGLGMLLNLLPYQPKSTIGWVWLFVLALPVAVVGEWLGDCMWKNRLARTIEKHTAEQSFSLIRIAYMLAGMLLFLITALLVIALFAAGE